MKQRNQKKPEETNEKTKMLTNAPPPAFALMSVSQWASIIGAYDRNYAALTKDARCRAVRQTAVELSLPVDTVESATENYNSGRTR